MRTTRGEGAAYPREHGKSFDRRTAWEGKVARRRTL